MIEVVLGTLWGLGITIGMGIGVIIWLIIFILAYGFYKSIKKGPTRK